MDTWACRQVAMLPSQRLVRPTANDDFLSLMLMHIFLFFFKSVFPTDFMKIVKGLIYLEITYLESF